MRKRECARRPVPLALLALVILFSLSGCGGGEGGREIVLRDLQMQDSLALYYPVPASAAAQVPGYRVNPDLSNVEGAARVSLSPQVRRLLAERGFAVVPAEGCDDLYQVYLSSGLPSFVTVDAVFKAFHLLCLRTLLEMEVRRLRADLEALLSALQEVMYSIYRDSGGTVREAAGKDLGFLGVARRLLGLDPGIPAEVRGEVEEECRLIESASSSGTSPLFGYREDYRAYIPPGAYASDASMGGYYRARTWLGRMGFPAYAGKGPALEKRGRDMARRSLLLVGALHAAEVGGEPALKVWDRVYQPLRFLAAGSLHLNAHHYSRLMREVFGDRLVLDELSDDARVDEFISRAGQEGARLLGTAAGLMDANGPSFHFLECGLPFGESVFESLTASGGVTGRGLPRGLDFPAVMGSSRALELLEGYYQEGRYEGYAEKVRETAAKLSVLEPYPARASLSWSWLDASRALLYPGTEGYPPFTLGGAWRDKDLHSFLACWVELGRGAAGAVSPREAAPGGSAAGGGGYVEPRPGIFAALAADADMLRRGLSERGLLDEATAEDLESFYRWALGLKAMAEKELAGQPLSVEERDVLSHVGETLRDLASGPSGELPSSPWVLTEVYADPAYGDVLRLALGRPYLCYVVAPVDGRPTLTAGALYSFYELAGPREKTCDEEGWRESLLRGERHDPPSWTSSFLR